MDNISLSLLTLYEALANSPYTTITGDLDTTATSITIVDPAAIPSTFPCLLTIGYDTSTAETVLATSISGDTLTVTRGVDGTLQTWTAGSRISRVFTAKDLNDIQTNISRIAAAIGSASLDTEAQTLVGAINELDAGKCKLVKGYLSSSTGAFYSDSGFTTLVTDNENPNNLYLDLNSYRLYKYIAVGTGVLDVGYNLITVDDDLDVIRTPKYGVCSTAAGTAAKAVTINGITSLVTGLTIAVKFSNNNTAASPTLQVNSLTAKPIYQHGTTPAGTDDATTGWYAGAVVILAYDGTGWVMSKGVNNALDAGDVVYDNQETYASGTVGKEVSDLNTAINVENWQGKHLLIIGDSWSLGWTGSVYCERPWCDVMVSVLGCTADYIRQGSGGFTHAASGNASNTYPNENFVQVLDHVQNNKYDAIIVQAGWNDIHNDDATDADLGTAIYNFATKVDNYFNKTTVYLIPSYPAYLMPYARLPRAETLVRTAYYQGMVVCHYSLNWLFTNKNYRGTDVPHPNQSGYSYWGRLAAAFLRGWDGKEIKGEQSWISIAGTISGDDNIIISPTIDTTYVQSSIQLYVRMSNGTVAVYSQFRTNANFPSTSNTNVTLVTGLPIPIVQSQYLNVQFRDVQTTKREPRCSLTYDGNLVITTTGDCSDAVIILYGNYQTRSNCIM